MLRFFDKMSEITTGTGTGALTLSGASSFDKKTFEDAEGFQVCYHAKHRTLAEYEIGIGTVGAGPRNISRDTCLRSSNSDDFVDFSAGNKDVFIVSPADLFHELFGGFSSFLTQPGQLWPGSGISIQGSKINLGGNYLKYDLNGSSSVILDWQQASCFEVVIYQTTNIRFSNYRPGQSIRLKISQGNAGASNTVTWYNNSNIRWEQDTAFSVSGSGKGDWLGFMARPADYFDGFVIGKLMPRD